MFASCSECLLIKLVNIQSTTSKEANMAKLAWVATLAILFSVACSDDVEKGTPPAADASVTMEASTVCPPPGVMTISGCTNPRLDGGQSTDKGAPAPDSLPPTPDMDMSKCPPTNKQITCQNPSGSWHVTCTPPLIFFKSGNNPCAAVKCEGDWWKLSDCKF